MNRPNSVPFKECLLGSNVGIPTSDPHGPAGQPHFGPKLDRNGIPVRVPFWVNKVW